MLELERATSIGSQSMIASPEGFLVAARSRGVPPMVSPWRCACAMPRAPLFVPNAREPGKEGQAGEGGPERVRFR